MDSEKAAPVIKWAGGKRQLIEQLVQHVPEEFGAYHEFFFGGGALFFELYNQGRIETAFLSDLNPRLMNVYKVIQQRPQELIGELNAPQYSNDSESFYKIRQWEPADAVEQAARFIYLNKTAFNGLYRENSSGKFNVPYGRYANPKICDPERILAVSQALSIAKLKTGDFSAVLDHAKAGDFAYFDPPYHPLSSTSNFTSYTKNSFSSSDQRRLKAVSDTLASRGVRVLLSNSSTPFVTDLYSGYEIDTVHARRIINCKAEGRGEVAEVLARSGYD